MPWVRKLAEKLLDKQVEETNTVEGIFARLSQEESEQVGNEVARRVRDAVSERLVERFTIAAVLVNFGLDVYNNSDFTSLFTWLPILLFNSIKYSYTLKRIPAETFGEDGKKMRVWIFIPTLFLVIGVVVLGFAVLQDAFNLSEFGTGRLPNLASGVIVAIFCLYVAIVTLLAISRENELPDIEDVEFN